MRYRQTPNGCRVSLHPESADPNNPFYPHLSQLTQTINVILFIIKINLYVYIYTYIYIRGGFRRGGATEVFLIFLKGLFLFFIPN